MFQYQLATWECNKASWNEASLSKAPDSLGPTRYLQSINPWATRLQFSAWPDVVQYMHLVREYTKRKLTFGQDGLQAISSLLSVMSWSFPGGFISGLPEMFFDEALLWQPAEPMQRRIREKNANNIPSWSWASWEGELERTWSEHWSHFLLYASNRTAAFQVKPAVEWFYGDSLEDRYRINQTSRTYRAHATDTTLPLPAKWTFNNTSYRYDNKRETKSTYPIPTSVGEVSYIVSPRYLFCRTTRGHFRGKARSNDEKDFGVQTMFHILQNSKGDWVGTLNVGLDLETSDAPHKETDFELVVISAGSLIGNMYQLRQFPFAASSDIIKWGYFDTSQSRFKDKTSWLSPEDEPVVLPSDSDILEFYYVLWIGWEDGIAYRRGLGRILKSAWDESDTDEIDLILG